MQGAFQSHGYICHPLAIPHCCLQLTFLGLSADSGFACLVAHTNTRVAIYLNSKYKDL